MESKKAFKKVFEEPNATKGKKSFSLGVSIISKYLTEDDHWGGNELIVYGDVSKIWNKMTSDEAKVLALNGWFIEEESSDSPDGHLAIFN